MNFYEIKDCFFDSLVELGVPNTNIKQISPEDISCKCPICGDSKYSNNKKRLHLYKKGEVINVNCFNGDCPVKNLTPWTFFKLYAPRTFIRFREISRKQYFNELYNTKVKEREFHTDLSFLDDPIENSSKLEIFIGNFEPGGSGEGDLELIKNFLKENPDCLNEFKILLKS